MRLSGYSFVALCFLGGCFSASIDPGHTPARTGSLEGFQLAADLDADGSGEVVTIAWSSFGGSGTFHSLLVSNSEGEELARADLGDRVQLRSGTIENGQIVLHTVEAGPGDALCCPGQKRCRSFTFDGGRLVEASKIDEGRLSLDDIGGRWRLLETARREAVPATVEMTLSVDGTRIGGSGGCNRFMGQIAAGEGPGEIHVEGPLASTMMACPPPVEALERDYLRKLEHMQRFSFTGGRLLIHWATDNEFGSLVFQRGE